MHARLAEARLNFPSPQSVHTLWPVPLWNEPGSHAEQMVVPLKSVKRPAEQKRHTVAETASL